MFISKEKICIKENHYKQIIQERCGFFISSEGIDSLAKMLVNFEIAYGISEVNLDQSRFYANNLYNNLAVRPNILKKINSSKNNPALNYDLFFAAIYAEQQHYSNYERTIRNMLPTKNRLMLESFLIKQREMLVKFIVSPFNLFQAIPFIYRFIKKTALN